MNMSKIRKLRLNLETVRVLGQQQPSLADTRRSECYCAPSVGPGCDTCYSCVAPGGDPR